MNENEKLIEEAAKAIADLHASSYVDEHDRATARAALAVFERAHAPNDDDREALEQAALDGLNAHRAQSTMDPTLIEERVGDAVWAAGFRRSEAPEPCGANPSKWVDHAEHYPCVNPKGHAGDHATETTTWPQGSTIMNGARLDPDRPEPPFPGEPHSPTGDEREALIDVMVMTRLSDYAATDMSTIHQAVDAILAAGFRRSKVPEPSAAQSPRCGCPCHYIPGVQHIAACCHPEPQGEPSDAQVEVAWRTYEKIPPDTFVMGPSIGKARERMRAALRAANEVENR